MKVIEKHTIKYEVVELTDEERKEIERIIEEEKEEEIDYSKLKKVDNRKKRPS